MRSRVKPPSHRTTKKSFCDFFAGILLLALWMGSVAGCSKSIGSGGSNTGESSSPRLASTSLMINSIPFGELNGDEEYNASAIVPIADSRFLICDNNTNDALFELTLTPDGQKKGPLIRRPLRGLPPGTIDDLEDMTLVEEGGRRYVFITSSMYVKKAKKDRLEIPPSGVLRVIINPDDTLSAENVAGFRDWLINAYPQLTAWANLEPDDGGLNIEGLAWDKSSQTLLFGVRTPAPGSKPFILPVKIKDFTGPWATSNLEAQPAIQLSIEAAIGEQGIRCLSYDQDRDAFLVLTGKSISDSKAPFALYEWSGNAKGETRRLGVNFAKKMKPEGITRGAIGGRSALVIVDDNGGFQVVWSDQQLPYAGPS